ncbi:MAG TPA: hypothetical protein VGL81_25045 [Polyangiaceae bacterium]|jgi:hypothetical protein
MKPAPLHRLVGDVRLVVRGPTEPSDEQFDAHIAEALAMVESVRVVLVVYHGSVRISPKQRARLVRTGLFDVPHAVLTDAVVGRAEIASIGALGAPVRAFKTREFDEACDYLAVARPVRAELLRHIEVMKPQLASE